MVCNKSNLTNWCYFINDEKSCLQSHMQIDNNLYLCHYDEKYKVCYGSNEMCLSPNESTIIWCSWAFLEFVSFTVMGCIHLYVVFACLYAAFIGLFSVFVCLFLSCPVG